jgi:hypothetical protein
VLKPVWMAQPGAVSVLVRIGWAIPTVATTGIVLPTQNFTAVLLNPPTQLQHTNDLDGYTGTIKAQAAENYQSIFYNVTESTTYLQ